MEFFDGFWIQLLLKIIGVMLVVLTGALVVIYAELKIGSHMQTRIARTTPVADGVGRNHSPTV